MATLTIRLRRPCGARMAIITTVPARTSAFAIHRFMAKHRPFHTVLRRRQSGMEPSSRATPVKDCFEITRRNRASFVGSPRRPFNQWFTGSHSAEVYLNFQKCRARGASVFAHKTGELESTLDPRNIKKKS